MAEFATDAGLVAYLNRQDIWPQQSVGIVSDVGNVALGPGGGINWGGDTKKILDETSTQYAKVASEAY